MATGSSHGKEAGRMLRRLRYSFLTQCRDPADSNDIEACERKLEFQIGWFADPIYKGDYPKSTLRLMQGTSLVSSV